MDDVDTRAERARKAAEMLARHVRLQMISAIGREELVTIVGEAVIQGWLHDASMQHLVEPALEVVEADGPEHIPIRVVEADGAGDAAP